MTKSYLLLVPLALGLSVAPKAFGHHDKKCKAEIETHCKDVTDKKAVLACLSQHEAELSDGCKKSHAKHFKKLKKETGT